MGGHLVKSGEYGEIDKWVVDSKLRRKDESEVDVMDGCRQHKEVGCGSLLDQVFFPTPAAICTKPFSAAEDTYEPTVYARNPAVSSSNSGLPIRRDVPGR